jgi:cobalamin biosynthesis protein CobW
MANDAVSVDILTGFLGSGKTTLLRHVLTHGLDGRRVAVVMNEIGDIGIDGRVIEGLNVERMIELGSGCVCCTVNREFGLALQEIVETVDPEIIIVETTGVADPPNIVAETRQVGLSVDATICVVDAANVDRHLAASGAAREQIAAADFLVLNKTDLVDAGERDRAEALVRAINPRAFITRATRGEVAADVLFGTAAGARLERPERAPDRDHLTRDRVSSFVHESSRPFERAAFERFLADLPPEIYRAKGIVRFTESAWSCLFNFTCGRAEYEWREPAGPDFVGRSVFIGAGASEMRDALTRRLDGM